MDRSDRSTHHVHRGPESLPCYCAATSDHPIGSEAPPPPAEQASGELSDEQCDAFRQMPGSFRDMVRMIYRAGQQGTFAPQQPEKGEG